MPTPPFARQAVAERTLQRGFWETCNAQAVANIAWAFATLQVRNNGLLRGITAQTQQPGFVDTFSSQAVANTAWAFATLSTHPAPDGNGVSGGQGFRRGGWPSFPLPPLWGEVVFSKG